MNRKGLVVIGLCFLLSFSQQQKDKDIKSTIAVSAKVNGKIQKGFPTYCSPVFTFDLDEHPI